MSAAPGAGFWLERAWTGGEVREGLALTTAADGTIAALDSAAEAPVGFRRVPGLSLPGAVNAHSHAFHRLLRGRTHADGGTFWTWRQVMYRAAAQLTPDSYGLLARAVFAEMAAAGYTAVGEFHYVHHARGGAPYPDHDMERALAWAAQQAGIRLVLLDTCYLTGGIGKPLSAEQARFGDGDIDGYLARHAALGAALQDCEHVTLGAAIHSVRAVPAADLPAFSQLTGPLHVHLSEQPAENEACLEAYGTTPTGLLERAGVLDARLSAVHATHLREADIAALGAAVASIVMCPTTEADLADGIGPARALADAGAVLALGSDQHVVLDPLLELRGLEAGERLGSGERGRFGPAELIAALTSGGARSLGLDQGGLQTRDHDGGGLRVGAPADFFALSQDSARTIGSRGEQAVLAGTSADVAEVVVAGRTVAAHGEHAALGPVAELYREAMAAFDLAD